jgi:signal peptide peptidase SppA
MDDPNDLITPAGSGSTLVHIASRVLNRPLLMEPTKAEVLLHVLEGRLPLEGSLAPLSPDASRFVGKRRAEGPGAYMYAVESGTAIIPIVGSLVNRGAWIGASSGLVSYEGIAAQLRAARDDTAVKSIMLDIDSGGGEATGMFAVAQLVREVAAIKPVVAFVNDVAASAAYGIASSATEIVVSPTSIVGSIGVVLIHMDRTGELAAKGIAATVLFEGAHKADGHPFAGPLSASVRADLQAEIRKFHTQFVTLVGEGRGAKLTADMARATEARTFLGQEAVDRGLADRVASLDAVLADLSTKRAAAQSKRSSPMSGENDNAVPQAQHTAAMAAARTEGATAERTRISGILTHAEAEGRADMARSLALDTDLTAEAAGKVLATAPKAAAPEANAGLKSIEERAKGLAEFGAGEGQKPAAGAEADAGYAKAIKKLNAPV